MYNLGPKFNGPTSPTSATSTANRRSSISASAGLETLPNYHHVHHDSLGSPFPFPHGYFTAVVFRFPVATNESLYRAAISECKRVLRPGGYLELSVLDMDMMNMGNRARRAVRDLKMRMQASDGNVSLKPVSDTIQRLVGRRGFENLKSCVVGVPVAGKIADGLSSSSASSTVSASASVSACPSKPEPAKKSAFGPQGEVKAIGSTDDDDEQNITTMVARVGRWWYSRCYETVVMQSAAGNKPATGGLLSKSIWSNAALLRECERQQTTFKLLVCHAQKPTIPPRRTVSV